MASALPGDFPAPADLRVDFLEWLGTVDQGAPGSLEPIDVDGGEMHPRVLLAKLEGCTNELPAIHCRQLGIPDGSTYGAAVEAVWASKEGGRHVG